MEDSEKNEHMKKVEELQNMHCFPFVSMKNLHREDNPEESVKTPADFFKLRLEKQRALEKDPSYLASRNIFYKTSGKNKTPPQIFQNCTFYFTGRMDNVLSNNSFYHLRNLAVIHGAAVIEFFAKKITTHVICNNLTLNKTYANSCGKVKFVSPKWISDSISGGKRLDENQYLGFFRFFFNN